MLLRLGLVAATGGGLVATQLNDVHAAGKESAESQKKIRPSQLPIYGEPEPPKLEFVPESETSFQQQISFVRKWTWDYLDSIQDQTDLVKQKYETAKAHSIDALKYLQEDSSVLPRIAVITVAGLGGIVAGYKGGKIKKTFLASVGMAAAASVCYPREAVEIGGAGWQTVTDFVKTAYRDNFPAAAKKPTKIVEPEESTSDGVEENTSVTEPVAIGSIKGDPGMSKAEDKDMYTTRDG